MTRAKAKAPAEAALFERGQKSGAAEVRPQSVYEARLLRAMAACPPDQDPASLLADEGGARDG